MLYNPYSNSGRLRVRVTNNRFTNRTEHSGITLSMKRVLRVSYTVGENCNTVNTHRCRHCAMHGRTRGWIPSADRRYGSHAVNGIQDYVYISSTGYLRLSAPDYRRRGKIARCIYDVLGETSTVVRRHSQMCNVCVQSAGLWNGQPVSWY